MSLSRIITRLLPRTLAGRILLVLILSGVGVTGSVWLIEQRLHGNRVHLDAIARHGILSHQSMRAMLMSMGGEKPASINDVLAQLAGAPGVQYIRVLDSTGKVSHSSDVSDIGKQEPFSPGLANLSGPQVVLHETDGNSFALIVEPLTNADRCQSCHHAGPVNGYLEMKLDTRAERTALDQDRRTVLALLVCSQGVLIVLVWLSFRLMLVQPARVLLRSMRQVAAGSLDSAVDIAAPSEFAELGGQFNLMVRRLREAQEERDRYYQESMTRADQMASVGELATVTAHEIRNPLTGISGVLQILAREPALEHRKPIIDELLATVDRLSKTVTDLLAFGRPPKPSLAKTDIAEVIDSVLRLLGGSSKLAGSVEITTDIARSLPLAMTDRQQLQQVLLNVVLNAVQAMPDGGTLHVAAQVRGNDAVCIRISDTGPGVPPENLDRIFAPFYTTKQRGTGLGLAISKRIIGDMGGTIRAESVPGEGLFVYITLPLEARVAS